MLFDGLSNIFNSEKWDYDFGDYEENCRLEFDVVWNSGSVPIYQCGLLLQGRQQNGLEFRHIDNILHAITCQKITVFNISRIKNMIRMIKSWKMKCAKHVARVQNENLMSCGSEMWPPAARQGGLCWVGSVTALLFGYLLGSSSSSFIDFCFDMQVFSIIYFSKTQIMLSKRAGMETSTDVSDVYTPLCKSTHVHMFDKLSSQYCSRPAEFRTVCANIVQRKM
jgi:hypothetical protein